MVASRRPRPAEIADAASAELVSQLEALYAEIDERYAQHSCENSTECCRFGLTGREPYVTSVELLLLEQALKRLGKKRQLPASKDPGKSRRSLAMADEGRCPLLSEQGRCTVYAQRPLGCRTFFCERASFDQGVKQREINGWVARLKELAASHRIGGEAGRLLTRALGSR